MPDYSTAPAAWGAGYTYPMPDRAQLEALADQKAAKYSLDPTIFKAMIGHESSWDPNIRGSSGEYGLGQLMPGTARDLGVTNPLDPDQNLEGAAKYLSQQYSRFGNYYDALSAYNAGPGNIQAGQTYAGIVLGKAGQAGAAAGGSQATVQNTGGPGGMFGPGGALGQALGGAFQNVTNFFWNVFLRVAVILLGIILLWQGLAMLRGTNIVENVTYVTNKYRSRGQTSLPKKAA